VAARSRPPALVAALVVVALLGWAGQAAAEKPARRDVLVFLRVLAYDKQLARRADEAVVVAVVYPTTTAGGRERDAWMAAFGEVKKVKVAGRPVIAVSLGFHDAAGLERTMADLAPAAVIVCGGLDAAVTDLRTVTRRHHVLSFSRAERDVRAGLAVAVVAGASRDEIVINLAAARAEGAKLDARLLQLARLVEEP
jgi:hypothetical protein